MKVSLTEGIVRFQKWGKLSLNYIGPFIVLERVREVAYRVALPLSLSTMHPFIHVSLFKRYVPDELH